MSASLKDAFLKAIDKSVPNSKRKRIAKVKLISKDAKALQYIRSHQEE